MRDYNVTCDQSGFVCKRSECVKTWDGLIVRRDFADINRHPQDFLKPVKEQPLMGDIRPEQPDPPAELPPITVDQMI